MLRASLIIDHPVYTMRQEGMTKFKNYKTKIWSQNKRNRQTGIIWRVEDVFHMTHVLCHQELVNRVYALSILLCSIYKRHLKAKQEAI